MTLSMERYYLGADPGWLWRPPVGLPARVGLFVSHRRLSKGRRLESATPYRRAADQLGWALDSGGFNELDKFGQYTFTAEQYAAAVWRYDQQIGGLEWAAPMDWMCEPEQLAKTGLTVLEHQRLTVANYVELAELWWRLEDAADRERLGVPDYTNPRDPEFNPFMPVLQGYTFDEYLRCIDLYETSGLHLAHYQVVGVGSVCRRSNTNEGVELFQALGEELQRRYPGHVDAFGSEYPSSLSLHAFGVTTTALSRLPACVETADSRAWCMAGMKRGGRCRHPGSTVQWEQNCPQYAVDWLSHVLDGTAVAERNAGGSPAVEQTVAA